MSDNSSHSDETSDSCGSIDSSGSNLIVFLSFEIYMPSLASQKDADAKTDSDANSEYTDWVEINLNYIKFTVSLNEFIKL